MQKRERLLPLERRQLKTGRQNAGFRSPRAIRLNLVGVLVGGLLLTLACTAIQPAAGSTSTPTVILENTAAVEPAGPPASEAEVPRVSLEQALQAHQAGTAIFVDVRSQQSYAAEHIPGAMNIPLGEFETNIGNLDLDPHTWIITYCT